MQALTQRCCFDREAYREIPKFRVWPSSDLFPSCPSCSSGQQQFVTCVKISSEMFLIRNCQRNNLTRNDGSSPRKERTLQGIQRWGFSWWKRFFSPCTPMGWHHGQSMGEGKCGDQKLLFGKWKNRLQMEKASCVWAMESPVLHSQAQVAKDTGSATEDGEGRERQEAWWQTLQQHSWHQEHRGCSWREGSTLQQHEESTTSQSLAFTWKWRHLAGRDTETTQSTLINTLQAQMNC